MVGEGAPILVRRALARAGLRAGPEDALATFMQIYDRRLIEPHRRVSGRRRGARPRAPPRSARGADEQAARTERSAFSNRWACAGSSRASSAATASTAASRTRPGLLALHALAPGDQLVMIGDSPVDRQVAVNADVPVRVRAIWLWRIEVRDAARHAACDRSCARAGCRPRVVFEPDTQLADRQAHSVTSSFDAARVPIVMR